MDAKFRQLTTSDLEVCLKALWSHVRQVELTAAESRRLGELMAGVSGSFEHLPMWVYVQVDRRFKTSEEAERCMAEVRRKK